MFQFLIPAISTLVGALAGGRAKGREQEAGINQQRDQLGTQQYQTQQNATIQAMLGGENANMNRANLALNQGGLDLQQRKFALEAPGARATQSVRGDMLSRSQPIRIPDQGRIHVNHIGGGFNAGMLSPETRQLGGLMSKSALEGQQKGDTFAPQSADVPQQNWGGAVLPKPGMTPLPEANGFDKFLNIASPILGVGSAIANAYRGDKDENNIQELLKRLPVGTQGPQAGGTPPIQPWQIPQFNPRLGTGADQNGLPIFY
jgi:hypothetical protein